MPEKLTPDSEQLSLQKSYRKLVDYFYRLEWKSDFFRHSQYAEDWNKLINNIGDAPESFLNFEQVCLGIKCYLEILPKYEFFYNTMFMKDLEGAIDFVENILKRG